MQRREKLAREHVVACREWFATSIKRPNPVECVKAARAVDAAEKQLLYVVNGLQRYEHLQHQG